jgi:hypothetical protein
MRTAAILTLLGLAGAWPAAQTPSPSPQQPLARVLFIGNSLTIANDLPATVAALAREAAAGGLYFAFRARTTTRYEFSALRLMNDTNVRP